MTKGIGTRKKNTDGYIMFTLYLN